MVPQMVVIVNSLWEISNYMTVAKAMMKLCIPALRNITCSIGTVYVRAITFATALWASGMVASGFMPSVSTIGTISAMKYMGEYMTDIMNSLGQRVGFDFTDRPDLNKAILAQTKKLHDYLAMPTSSWNGDKYAEIESFSQECHAMVQTTKGIGDTVTLPGLMKLINDIDDRLISIREEWVTQSQRTVPVGLYLWSEPGALGKTDFVRRLTQVVASRIQGFNDRVYSMQPAAVHFARYYGEHTMHYDEVSSV